jgi:hypothetical protein
VEYDRGTQPLDRLLAKMAGDHELADTTKPIPRPVLTAQLGPRGQRARSCR